jgi:hypothetical protein
MTHWDEAAQARDLARDRWLESQGVAVMRVDASSIYRDLDAVAAAILARAEAMRGL